MKMLHGIVFGMLVSSMAYGMDDRKVSALSLKRQAMRKFSGKRDDTITNYKKEHADTLRLIGKDKFFTAACVSFIQPSSEKFQTKPYVTEKDTKKLITRHEENQAQADREKYVQGLKAKRAMEKANKESRQREEAYWKYRNRYIAFLKKHNVTAQDFNDRMIKMDLTHGSHDHWVYASVKLPKKH